MSISRTVRFQWVSINYIQSKLPFKYCSDHNPISDAIWHNNFQCRFPFPFCSALADVVPHLAAEHAVTPVPVQPAGMLFYRAKNFFRRNIWTMIYSWDKPSNLFRFIVKHVHALQVGRSDNCNLLIAHIQYIGPESMASRYCWFTTLKTSDKMTFHLKQTGCSVVIPCSGVISSVFVAFFGPLLCIAFVCLSFPQVQGK